MFRKVVCRVAILAATIGVCASMSAQTVSAHFGSFYGVNGTQQIDANVTSPPAAGQWDISTGKTFETSVGEIEMPPVFDVSNGIVTFPVTFIPNGVDGSFSGNYAPTYVLSSNPNDKITMNVEVSGDSMIATATAGLAYQVLAVLYTAPGNASSSGFSNTESAGATTQIQDNFSQMDTITFNGGFLGVNNDVTFSQGKSSGSTTSSTTSYQASSSVQLSSTTQKMDHTQDQIYLLIDPSVTVTQNATAAGFYNFGPSLDATGNFGTNGIPPDILNVNIEGLDTPSSIPLAILEPQVPISGTTLPGLSIICANPLPPDQCTQQNACGCKSTDFASIVSQDELASDTVDSTQPSSIDPARYVYIEYFPLQGPDQSGSGPVKTTFTVSDSDMNSESTSNGTSYGVGFTHQFGLAGPFTLTITDTNSFTYSQTQTAGTTNGTAHTAMVTLGTSDVGCYEYVDVYEDTTYHTFAYALSQAAPPDCQ